MKTRLFILLFLLSTALNSTSIKGAGSTFASPLIYSFAYHYYQATNIEINYQSIGSFSGLNILKLGSIDFVSSDKKLTKYELDKYKLEQFYLMSSIIDITHNIEGVKDRELKITSKVLAKIFLGEILYWDDSRILQLNRKLNLPHKKISVIIREGKSGTTYHFTSFLNISSIDWAKIVGVTKELKLKHALSADSNESITSKILSTPFSIGYIPYPYIKANKLPRVLIEDKNNSFIKMDNFIVVSKDSFEKNKELFDFFEWIANNGQDIAKELGYYFRF
jgi:phosphate transport system substrate-binding protein